MRGELDWVVMKALEKDRRRRYETASDFAADVMRYLTDRPVEAFPPSSWYRLTKFVRRNRVAISTGAVVASALVLGTAVSTWQAIRAESGERQARANLKKAREAVDQMLVSVAGRLADVPHMESVRRELLADSLKFYEGFLQEQGTDPEVHFETGLAHFQFGEIQTMLGEDRPAEQAYLQAIRIFQDLSDRTPGNAEYRHNLAHGHNKLGNLLRENCGRLAEAEQAYRQALAITRKLDADFPGRYRNWVAGRLNNIGLVLHASGRLTEAESVHREALAIRIALDPYSGVVAESYSNLGIVLKDAHRLAEAEQSHRQAVEIRRKQASLSPNSRHLASRFAAALQNLAVVLAKTGRLAEAESSYRTALAIDEKQAFDFPNIPAPRRELAGTRYNLGNLLRKAGRLAEAEKVYGESLVVSGKLAADFPNTPVYREILAGGHRNLGILLMRSNRLPEAESSFLRAQHIYEALAVEHPGTPDYRYEAGDNIGDVGLVLLDTGRIGEVETLLRRGLASAEKLVSELPDVKMYRKSLSNAHNNLGILHYRRGDWEAAVVSLRKGAELFREHEDDGDAQFALAMALWRIGDKEQARTSYDQAVLWMDKSEPFNERLRRFRAEATQLLKDK